MFSSVAGLGTNSSASSSNSFKNGIGGLVSGVDTSKLVKAMTTNAQAKIDSVNQKTQKVGWKQQLYRDVISQVVDFKNSFFDVLSDTNLTSTSAFNVWSVSSSSSAVTATTTAANTGAKLIIKSVDSLATAQTVKSASTVSGGIASKQSIDSLKNKELSITLDGVTKNVSFTEVEGQDFATTAQNALNTAFGANRVKIGGAAAGFELSVEGSSTLSVTGTSATLSAIGLSAGQSNRVDITKTLANTSFATELVGDTFEFTINGVDFSFSATSSVMHVINTVNSSSAGVKLNYSDIDDKFTLSSTKFGTGENLTVSQTKGNLLSSMLGYDSSEIKQVTGSERYSFYSASEKNGTDLEAVNWADLSGKSFQVSVNGVTKTISLADVNEEITEPDAIRDAVINSLNEQLATAFGNKDVEFVLDEGGNFSLLIAGNKQVSFSTVDEEGAETELLSALGFSAGKLNELSTASTLSSFGVTGGKLALGTGGNEVEITYEASDSIESLLNKINAVTGTTNVEAGFENGKFTIKGAIDGEPLAFSDTGSFSKTVFGISAFDNSKQAKIESAGKNATITLADDTKIERSSNSFAVNGVMLQLNEVSKAAEGVTPEPITISSAQNVDKVVETFKKFTEKYNEIITKVKGLLTQEVYTAYPPLTDAQRAEMTEKEIQLWEDKAKSGILKNDDLLNDMLIEFDNLLIAGSENSSYNLASLGIDFNTSITEGTKLVFNEEKFRKAISEDFAGVTAFFTEPDAGLADKFNALIEKYTSSSIGAPGKLVDVSGTTSYTDSQQAKELKELTERLANLKNKLTEQETRLWKQFSAMEEALASLNSQSSWLTSMLGSSN